MIEIANKLKEYNNFQECIIEDIILSDFGTSVSISFNYIWTNKHVIRKDLDFKNIVTLKFFFVNKFLIENDLTQTIVDSPNMINWGFNEISTIHVLETSNNKFLRAEIAWETEHKIIIEFVKMHLEEKGDVSILT